MVLGLAVEVAPSSNRVEAAQSSPSDQARPDAGDLVRVDPPMTFEENRGQVDDGVDYVARANGYQVFLTGGDAVVALGNGKSGFAIRMEVLGGAVDPDAVARGPQPGSVNYFVGDDPARWRTDIRTFAAVEYEDVYPGVDLRYHGNEQQLQYDFVVAPGADPAVIGIGFEGAASLHLDGAGDLQIGLNPGRSIGFSAPVSFQDVDGVRVPVHSAYVLDGDTVSFVLGEYDPSLPLVIDPTLEYGTYLGGIGSDLIEDVEVDASGNVYAVGSVTSGGYPTTVGAFDTVRAAQEAVVTKLSPDGSTLVYSTYLGGAAADKAYGLALHPNGEVTVAGSTGSSDFATVNAYDSTIGGSVDGFVTRLAANGGSLVYSTFLGGSGFNEAIYDVAVDGAGNAWVTGYTDSSDFPLVSAFDSTLGTGNDAFVAKLAASGSSLLSSSYLGGSDGSDSGNGIAVDGSGNAYVTGSAASTNFPTTASAFSTAASGGGDLFVSKVAAAGSSLAYSTYVGGSGFDRGSGIEVDGSGVAYVAGYSQSTNFPVSAGAYDTTKSGTDNEGVVLAVDASLSGASSRVFASYLGGTAADLAYDVALGATTVYVAGSTGSGDLPVTADAHQAALDGSSDAFLAALSTDGSTLTHLTYLGGSSSETAYGIDVDTAENVYLSGSTGSSNFDTTAGAYDQISNGGTDGFVVKFSGVPQGALPGVVTVNSTGNSADNNPGNGVCSTGGTVAGSPECTLRAAIQEANASATVDTIHFNIPITDGGYTASPVAFRIRPSGSVLPDITGPVVIDATTQPEFSTAGRPVVVLDGSLAPLTGDPNGLSLNAGSSTIRGLVIQNFGEDGIEIDVAGNNLIVGNYIGTDVTGTLARPNGVMDLFPVGGISIKTGNNTIGGAAAADRNVISGNTQFGIAVRSGGSNNIIRGNYIGTNALGNAMVPNQDPGIYLDTGSNGNTIGGSGAGEGNVISGNNTTNTATSAGVYVLSSSNTIRGNLIGTDSGGTTNLRNDGAGITLASGAANNVVGGTVAGARNTIAFNTGDGVRLMSTAGTGNSILGNSIHTNEDPGLGIDLDNDGVTANDSGDGDSGANDLLNFPVMTSAVETGGTVTVTFDLDAPAGNYRVEFFRNTAADGSGYGEGETFVSAVTATPGTGRTYTFAGSSGDIITATATRDLGGGTYGSTSELSAIRTVSSSTAVTVNSTGDSGDNNVGDGVCNTGGTVGSDPECTLRAAIREANASATIDTIHFDIPAAPVAGAHTIAPSAGRLPMITATVDIDATTEPDYAGTPVVVLDGSSVSAAGLELGTGSDGSRISGLSIHSFQGDGLSVGTDSNTIVGNWIGADQNGTGLGNQNAGIYVWNGAGNRIGGTTAGDANLLADNADGIVFESGTGSGNTVLGNSIYLSSDLGIDLGNDGVTPNDVGDGDSGPNDLLNYPAITSASESGGTVTVTFDLDVPANPDQYRVEFFTNPSGANPGGNGDGETFVSAATIAPGTGLTHTFSGALGDVITATATRIDSGASSGFSSTSEFSAAYTVTGTALDPVVFDNVQSGTLTLAGGSSSATATISAVDPSRSFLTYSLRGNSSTPSDFTINGVLTNSTTLTFSRVGTTGSVTIEWSVVEFASGVTVQRGTESIPNGGPIDVAISSVDLSRSFVLANVTGDGNTYGTDDFVIASLTSSTNLRLDLGNGLGSNVAWQVVQYNEAVVQRGTTSFGSGDASRTAVVTAVDPAKSWLVYNHSTVDGSANNIGQKLVRGLVTDPTTLTFDRSSTGQTMDLAWELVEFTDSTEVQHASANFTTSTTTRDVTVAAVDPTRSIAVGGTTLFGGRSAYTSNDNPGVGWFTTRLTSSTNLRVQRDAALATADLGWFVIHWPGGAAPASGGLWVSTAADVGSPSGVADVDSWSAGALLGFDDPGLAVGSGGATAGTMTLLSDFDAQGQDGNVVLIGLHQVQTTITVGTGPSVTLQPGDLLFSVANNETFVNANLSTTTIADKDVGLFRPAVPGDYSSGTFSVLLDQPLGGLAALTLVETETVLPDITLAAGTFLLTNSKIVYQLVPTAVGDGISPGTPSVLLNGPDAGLDKNLTALDLVEEWTVLGGAVLPAGTFLVSMDGEDLVGSNDLSTTRRDVFALTLSATTAGSGTGAGTAEHFFVGSDIGLDTNNEAVSGFAVIGGVPATAPVAYDDAVGATRDLPATVRPLDNDIDPNGDPLSLDSFTQGTNGTVTGNGDDTVTYTPDPGWTGVDTFTYTVSDASETDTGTVIVTVTPHSDPMAVWRRNGQSTPFYATWNGSAFTAAQASAVTGEYRTMEGAESPTRDEAIVIGVNSANQVTSELWDGSAWTAHASNPLSTVTDSFWWGFDVAYESVSGDAVIVYNNGTTSTAGLSYRVWNGSTWSGPFTITTPLAGEPKAMKLASHPYTDEMVLVVSNATSQDYALVWDGSSWGNAQVLAPDGTGNDRTDVDVAYEQQSGDAVVVFSQGADTNVHFRVWTGSAWSNEFAQPTPGGAVGYPRWIVLASDPSTDRIAMGVLANGADVWLATWTGSGFTDATVATTATTGTNHPAVAVAFESTSGQALATYGEGVNTPRYRTWTSGSGWSGESDAPDVGGSSNSMMLDPEPGTDGVMFAVQDDSNDLNYLSWNGGSWGTPTQLESNTAEIKNQPFLFLWNAPPTPAPPSPTVTVNSTGDGPDAFPGNGICDTGGVNSEGDPECTLRAAMEEANASVVVDTIHFAIPATDTGHSGGVWTVTPGSALPTVTTTVSIDGTTQPGWTSTPVVEIDGTSAGAGVVGFRISATDVTIRGFAINRFPSDGIEVEPTGSGAVVVGNHIGVDASGLVDRGNGDVGIQLRSGSIGSTIGGATATDRNVLSGNDGGIFVDGSDGNTIIGNYIGTDVTGNAAIPNLGDGIYVANGADGNTFGQPGAGNVLSGNDVDALEIDHVSTGNIIQANIIGLGADGNTLVENGRYGVVLYDGVNTTQIGGSGAGEGNVISGNVAAGVVIDGNGNAATSGNVIEGNLIGTDSTGTLDRGNGTYGVHLFATAVNTTIGGTTAGAGNTISGNGSDGVFVSGAATSGTLIQGNYIGLTAAGDAALGNTGNGVEIDWDVPNQVIGGAVAGAGNVISANLNGIYSLWANDMTIQGNIIGLDVTGTVDLGNVNIGIRVGGTNVVIGGVTATARNVVSGNNSAGILLDSATSAVVRGNYIGTDVTGQVGRGNGSNGVYVSGSGNRIGGTAVGAGNVISGNTNDGIQTSGASTGTVIEGNTIGLASDGSTPVPNSFRGISLYGTGTRVGGTTAAAGNTISGNFRGVVVVTGATDAAILGNAISGNSSLGIDLANNGVTPNDPGDGDAGANDLLNFPEINNASESGGTVTVDFDLDVPVGDYRVEFFSNPSGADPSGYGEGEIFVGAVAVTEGKGLLHTFPGSIGDVITATATRDLGAGSFGSTSEFSIAFTVGSGIFVVNSTGDTVDALPGNGVCSTGGTNSQGATECTLRAAIAESNAVVGADMIRFAVPATEPGHAAGVWTIRPGSALPAITDQVDLDGTTQAGWTAMPVIELDGSSLGGTEAGIRIDAAGTRVSGLAVGNFPADGVSVSADDVTIRAMHVGLGADGTTDVGNGAIGIAVTSGDRVMIGGSDPLDRNVIGNQPSTAIVVNASTDSVIRGNLVGVQADGVTPAPNDVGLGTTNTTNLTIGGTGADDGNVISGNTWEGIVLDTATVDAVVLGNRIGVGADGTTPVPNGWTGVLSMTGSTGAVIGGRNPGEGNTIADNGGVGVRVLMSGLLPQIVGNRIHDNAGIGIDIGIAGVTAPDSGDEDGHPNQPTLLSARQQRRCDHGRSGARRRRGCVRHRLLRQPGRGRPVGVRRG